MFIQTPKGIFTFKTNSWMEIEIEQSVHTNWINRKYAVP